MGLFWSMRAVEPTWVIETLDPLRVTLTAEAGEQRTATATIERLVLPDGVSVRDVEEQGLVGKIFRPAGPGPFPAVITLAGSGGGLLEDSAALLAGHGFASLALAYFNYGPLPREMINIPLEYFETALDLLAAQPGVRPDAVAVLGASRGGELALLLGATFPRLRAVVGIVPSHVVNAGTEAGLAASRPSWSYRGQSLPFLPRRPPTRAAEGPGFDDGPIALAPSFLEALADEAAVDRATIPVERINGPVLVVSAKDDRLAPSTLMAERVIERLERHRHPYPYRHLAYDGAGHLLRPPYRPTTVSARLHPVRNVVFAYGGTPKATAFAQASHWPQVVRFLHDSLQSPPASNT
jgi:dienelactone hydrolase